MNSLTARLKGYTKFQIVHNLGTLEAPNPETLNYNRLGPAMKQLRSLHIARREVALYGYIDGEWINLFYSHTPKDNSDVHIPRQSILPSEPDTQGTALYRSPRRSGLASEAAEVGILPYRPLP